MPSQAALSLIIPPNDDERIAKLYQYDILDTAPEDAYDKVAKLACQIFDTPSGFVTFVDGDRVFFKSNISQIEGSEVSREESFCSLAILDQQVTVINDTHDVPELLINPFVSMGGKVRFYAGAPLKTHEGHQLGTVCVTDSIPRQVTKKQLIMLETLSSIIMDELENRLASRKAVRVQTDLMNITIHDLKSPLAAIKLYGQLINKRSQDNDVQTIAQKLTRSANGILESLNDLLNLSQIENGDIKINREVVDLNEMLRVVKNNFEILAKQKDQKIQIHHNKSLPILADGSRIQDVFENLLSNAIKYAYPETVIDIYITEKDEFIEIEFRDQGQGLNEADLKKLFIRYAKLSAVPTGKERSNGLGLSIVKTLIELHQGKVWAQSKGKGLGSSFFVSLPASIPKMLLAQAL